MLCEVLEISRDSYYKWLKRKNIDNKYEIYRNLLKPIILEYYKKSKGTAGYRQIKYQIDIKKQFKLSLYMAYKLKCKELKLPEVRIKRNKHAYITSSQYQSTYVYKNLTQNLQITNINQVLSTDTTELDVDKRKQNISFIIDAYSSEILSSCISKSLDTNFIDLTLSNLFKNSINFNNIILHSDRGSMYKSFIYNKKTTEYNIKQSLSAPYTCKHNTWVENINGQFKDFIKYDYPKNLDELQIALNEFVYYNNNIKIKEKLNKMTPIQYRCHNA